MEIKEVTNKENLMEIINLLDSLKIKYWIEGGWGVDILLGKQNREHRDVDVDFDAAFTETLLSALKKRAIRSRQIGARPALSCVIRKDAILTFIR